MSFWAKLFGRSVSPAPAPIFEGDEPQADYDELKSFVTDAYKGKFFKVLQRLEKAGLRLKPGLDRDLIFLRFLLRMEGECGLDFLDSFFEPTDSDRVLPLDMEVFLRLAAGDDVFYDDEPVKALRRVYQTCPKRGGRICLSSILSPFSRMPTRSA